MLIALALMYGSFMAPCLVRGVLIEHAQAFIRLSNLVPIAIGVAIFLLQDTFRANPELLAGLIVLYFLDVRLPSLLVEHATCDKPPVAGEARGIMVGFLSFSETMNPRLSATRGAGSRFLRTFESNRSSSESWTWAKYQTTIPYAPAQPND